MTNDKTPNLQQVGNRTDEFARLVLELAVLNPERLREFDDEMRGRSLIPNKTS